MEYSAKDGLCDNFVYTIVQGETGYLWLGTGEGICRFDGLEFESDFYGDPLPKSPVRTSFRDSKNRIWFGFDNGNIALLEGGRFTLITPPVDKFSVINGFEEDENGLLLVATQDKGIISVDDDLQLTYFQKGIEGQLISSFCLLPDDQLLIGTYDGLFLYGLNSADTSLSLLGRLEEIPYTNVQKIYRSPGIPDQYYIATADDGLFLIDAEGKDILSAQIQKKGGDLGLQYTHIRSIYKDENNALWLGTWGEGLLRLNYSDSGQDYTSLSYYSENDGISGKYIQSIFADMEGNLWFGNYGAGLAVLRDQSFSFYTSPLSNFTNNIYSVLQVEQGFFLGSENTILVTGLNGNSGRLIGIRDGLPVDDVTSMFLDSLGTIWVGTSRSGIYHLNSDRTRATRFYSSPNSLDNMINRITGKGRVIWVATNGGVFRFDIVDGSMLHYTTRDKLPHNKIQDIFIDKDGEVWIANPGNGIFSITLNDALRIDTPAELDFVSIAQDQKGDLWAVTEGDGVFEFTMDSLSYYSSADGLRNNYCYSVMEDINGSVWIGHRLGMSRILPGREVIKTYSVDQGITADCNVHAIISDDRERLIFGTSEGLIIYDPLADKPDTLAPFLNISALTISDQPYDFTADVNLPYDIYKIRIDFRGINLKNPSSVTYQYKLEGYDDWSDPTDIPYVIYSRIEDGNYTFMLRACDENGICTQEPLTLNISVKIPFWKTWWFIVLSFVVVLSTVFIIFLIRERKQRQIQEYLQKELDERTKEVREQAQEIENKNRDITDSINYAQRIQASILPPINRLQKTFSGSFVFYQPRDIVSGDFYWYDKIWDNKFVIVCADSTGHGVPGAFMSMIGTTLIKDICSRSEEKSPAQILETLDHEVQEALNQNLEAEKSNDGMDIIVAEIDLTTNYLRIASAMRPVILYINDEQVYVKGSRSSVGGRFDEDVDEKVFEEESFQMSPGDIIYMFSDGYPDQFGGPLGKKFKMVRLRNLIRDIHNKPMEEQYNYVKSNFMLWKEDLEQVDDVLFMGIKI